MSTRPRKAFGRAAERIRPVSSWIMLGVPALTVFIFHKVHFQVVPGEPRR